MSNNLANVTNISGHAAMALRRIARGLDGETSVHIRYTSPPPGSYGENVAHIAGQMGTRSPRPRHTPLDACAAQDAALGKAEAMEALFQKAVTSRRDSGVSEEADDESEVHAPASELDGLNHGVRITLQQPDGIALGCNASSYLDSGFALPTVTFIAPQPTQKPIVYSEGLVDDSSTTRSRSSKNTTSYHNNILKGTSARKDRRRSNRRSRTNARDDLKIDGTPMLDPTSAGSALKVKQYRDEKGRWWEVEGDGRPDWATAEKEIIKFEKTGRRKSAYLSRHALSGNTSD